MKLYACNEICDDHSLWCDFFSSGFFHNLGSPERLWISFLHFVVMSSTSYSFNPHFPYPFYTCLFTWFSVFLSVSFPYHYSLFSVIFFVTGATFTDRLTCSFLILSFFVTFWCDDPVIILCHTLQLSGRVRSLRPTRGQSGLHHGSVARRG